MQKFKKAKKERDHSKLNGFFIAGGLTLIVTVILYGILIFAENAVLGKYDKVTVYTATVDVEKGTPLKADMFEAQLVDRRIVPSDALAQISTFETTVAEFYANGKISKNGILCKKDITRTAEQITGSHVVGVNVKDVSDIVNGTIRTSDFVDIYILKDGENINYISPEFTNVYVLAVFSNNGTPIENSDKESVARRFNVSLDEDEATRLIGLMQTGTVIVSKVIDE